ncbi:MAG: hypothetical protein GEU79_06825 [Acidimicrobiia bacterium]|nr:hypothetical protein [Acidimicrobiia bacterium]
MSDGVHRYQRPGEATGITEDLADFAVNASLADIDEGTRSFGVLVLLDAVASALAGTHGLESTPIQRMALVLAGSGECTVIGGGDLDPGGAALVNGYHVTAVTVCDVHKPLLCHVTPEVVPPALAIAQRERVSGADLLTSIIVGSEVAIRVGLGLNYEVFRSKGWHSPGVIGPFGGATAVVRLLDGDQAVMRDALGLAGSQSSGTFAAWGTPTIKFHQSRGALSGLMAGLLANEGFAASPDILTHPDGGLLNTHSDGGRPDSVLAGLGDTWEFNQLTLRRWPLASGFQSLVEAMMDVVVSRDLSPEDIVQVEVKVPPDIYEMYHDFPWETKFQAHLSPRFVAAVIAHDRASWLNQFDDERRQDPRINDFAESRVRIKGDARIKGEGASVTVTMGDGEAYTSTCLIPAGDPDKRLTRSELIDKFHDARDGILDDATADNVIEGILNIDSISDVAPLIAQLGRP